jgi:hypothetical protein
LLASQMDKVEEREPARPVRKIKARRRA